MKSLFITVLDHKKINFLTNRNGSIGQQSKQQLWTGNVWWSVYGFVIQCTPHEFARGFVDMCTRGSVVKVGAHLFSASATSRCLCKKHNPQLVWFMVGTYAPYGADINVFWNKGQLSDYGPYSILLNALAYSASTQLDHWLPVPASSASWDHQCFHGWLQKANK